MQTFAEFELAAPILRSLEREGYTTPTPIQRAAIAPALEGRDLLACAQTGTGKTAAFLLPTIHRLLETPPAFAHRGVATPRALVLSPTRELASQIADSFGAYARFTQLRETTVVGGVSQRRQEVALARGCDLLVATPGRLQDLINQGIVDLGSVEVFVLDEADRMLDMGFIQPIREIASDIPESRQTLMFSATMPRAIADLARSLLRDPVRITIEKKPETARLIEQRVYHIDRPRKQALLHHLLIQPGVDRAIVFTRTKHGAERLSKNLQASGFECAAIHGNKTQRQRDRALDAFRHGDCEVLVATDVAARGLDVDGVTHVFNYDLPDDPESYVHRIGRTGRAGAAGIAIAFCDAEERKLLRAVEAEIGARVPVAELPPRSAPSADRPSNSRPMPQPPAPQAPQAQQARPKHPTPPTPPASPARQPTRENPQRESRPARKAQPPRGAPAKAGPGAKHRRGAAQSSHPLASNAANPQSRPAKGGVKSAKRTGPNAAKPGKPKAGKGHDRFDGRSKGR